MGTYPRSRRLALAAGAILLVLSVSLVSGCENDIVGGYRDVGDRGRGHDGRAGDASVGERDAASDRGGGVPTGGDGHASCVRPLVGRRRA